MFRKILIANRGEIAVRVIRACREMGIETVAVYSQPDQESLHVQLADEAICIGPGSARDSYLNIVNILSATILTNAEAIHPGYGLLSENTKFARMCEQCNIKFIGPTPDAMAAMGNKLNARLTMIAADVPVVPGSNREVLTVEDAKKDARRVGYPVLVKAAAGGGGKGIRRVDREVDLQGAMEAAQAEALAAFGDATIYVEKLLDAAHHIEFQILCDEYGHAVHLFERDCSMQLGRQKLVEETPSSIVSPELREKMGDDALRAALAASYTGAGTIEYLLDDAGNYYFIEMNTRVQVEHPVTESITGIDIIREQISVAAGQELSFSQEDVKIHGHALECRLNACNPAQNFAPSCGTVDLIHMPGGPGVRIDSMLYDGCKILPFYDSMMGKIIVHAENREDAIIRMKRALDEVVIRGVMTNADFQYNLIDTERFQSGNFTTDCVEKMLESGELSTEQ